MVPIERFSVVLRHANRLYINKNNIFNIYVLSIQGVGVSIVNEIPLYFSEIENMFFSILCYYLNNNLNILYYLTLNG